MPPPTPNSAAFASSSAATSSTTSASQTNNISSTNNASNNLANATVFTSQTALQNVGNSHVSSSASNNDDVEGDVNDLGSSKVVEKQMCDLSNAAMSTSDKLFSNPTERAAMERPLDDSSHSNANHSVDRTFHRSSIVPTIQNVVSTVNSAVPLDLKMVTLHARNAGRNDVSVCITAIF